jgi:chromosome segregation ATPase
MFRKWLSPEGASGGGAGGDPQDPPAPLDPPKPPAAGTETAEQKLAASLAEATRWQTGYAGLQKTLAKKEIAFDDLSKKFDTEHSALTTLQATHTTVQTELEKLKGTVDELEVGKTSVEVQLKRAKIIMKKYPHLAEWEADGQLPETPVDAKDEDIDKLFQSFSDKLAVAAKQSGKSAGGSPPPPGGDGGTPSSAAEELKQANAASAKGDMVAYNEHYAKYLELLKAH